MLQYDELEASFYQVLKEKNLSWFGTLIAPSPQDDSSALLSISKKSYRDLILANTISVFDFRIYLLARQCELLAKMGRLNEVCRKVGAFLGAFGRRLREVEVRHALCSKIKTLHPTPDVHSTIFCRVMDILLRPQRCGTVRCLGNRTCY